MKQLVNVGLYGCNPYRTRQLMEAMGKVDPERVRVRMCFDIDHAKADQAAATYGGRACYDLDTFRKADFDLAIVCLPPYLHPDAFVACAAAGKDVYLEKPVCVDDAGRDKLMEAMRQYRPTCYVGICSPYIMPHRKALEIRRRPGAGAFIAIHHHRYAPSSGRMPGNPNWRHRLEESGGELNQHCCHDMHYFRLVGGDPESVSAMAYTSPGYQPAHEEEEVAACFRFKQGMGIFTLSQRSHRAHLTGQIHMERYAIRYDWSTHSRVQVFGDRLRAADETHEWDTSLAARDDEDMTVLQTRDFLDAYRNERPMPITLGDGIQAYEMTKAIRESYRVRREVPVPPPVVF